MNGNPKNKIQKLKTYPNLGKLSRGCHLKTPYLTCEVIDSVFHTQESSNISRFFENERVFRIKVIPNSNVEEMIEA